MLLRVLLCSLVLSSTAIADPFRWQGEDPIALRADAGRKKATGIALMVFGSLNLTLAIGMGVGGSITCERTNCELFSAVVLGVSTGAGMAAAVLLGAGIPLYGAGVRRGARADRIEAAARRELPAGYPAPWEQREDSPAVEARGRNHREISRGLLIGGGVTLGLGLLGIGGWVGCAFSGGSCHDGLYLPSVLSAIFGTSTGIVLTSIGGHFARRSQVELRLALGSTVGLTGSF
jgi:hypothetical protein